MTTCVVEFTVLVPEFPGGCGGESGKVRKRRERGRKRDLGVCFLGEKGKKKEEEKKGEETKDETLTNINPPLPNPKMFSQSTPRSPIQPIHMIRKRQIHIKKRRFPSIFPHHPISPHHPSRMPLFHFA